MNPFLPHPPLPRAPFRLRRPRRLARLPRPLGRRPRQRPRRHQSPRPPPPLERNQWQHHLENRHPRQRLVHARHSRQLKIWLTTATADGHDFFAICVDPATGKILSNQKVFHHDDPEPLGNDVNCYASPSPTIEPAFASTYVHFGSYGTACLDTATYKILWQRDDLPCRHYRGPASSPIIFNDLLILTLDGIDLQYLTALDKKTGHTVWKTDRTATWNDLDGNGKPMGGGDFRKGFSTPLIETVNGKTEMFSLGSKAVYAYDPRHWQREL